MPYIYIKIHTQVKMEKLNNLLIYDSITCVFINYHTLKYLWAPLGHIENYQQQEEEICCCLPRNEILFIEDFNKFSTYDSLESNKLLSTGLL